MNPHHPPSSDPNSGATTASASAMKSCVVCVPKSHVERKLQRSTGSGIDLIVSISASGPSGSPSSPSTAPLHDAQNRTPRASTSSLVPQPTRLSGFVQSGFNEVAFSAMSTVVPRDLTEPSRFANHTRCDSRGCEATREEPPHDHRYYSSVLLSR